MKVLRWVLIAVLLALAVLYLKPHLKDFEALGKNWRNLNYFYLALAAAAIIFQYIGDGLLSQILLKMAGHKIAIKDTVKIASIDVFAAHILPIGQAGVIATIAYFYRKIGVERQKIVFMAVAWSIITTIVLAFILIVSLLFLPELPNVPFHLSKVTLFVILVLPFLILINYFFGNPAYNLFRKISSRLPFLMEIIVFFSDIKSHKNTLFKNKPLLLQAFLAAFLYFGANIASLYWSFLVFGYSPNPFLVSFAFMASVIAAAVTFAPAGLGATEATMLIVFVRYGLNSAVALSAILIFRLFAFWIPIPVGFFSYFSLKKEQSSQTQS